MFEDINILELNDTDKYLSELKNRVGGAPNA